MNKKDLVAYVLENTELKKKEAEGAVDSVLEGIMNGVCQGKKVSLYGFGIFERRKRAARKGRNPRTGEEIMIEERFSPTFKAGKNFKDIV